MRQSLAAISRGKARQLKTKSYQLPLPSEVAFKRKNGAPLTGKRVFLSNMALCIIVHMEQATELRNALCACYTLVGP